MTGWYRTDGDGIVIHVRVQPNAKSNAIAAPAEAADGGQELIVRLAAKPVDGAANKALLNFMAREIGVPKSAIRIVSGEKNRHKRLYVSGNPAALNRGLGIVEKRLRR